MASNAKREYDETRSTMGSGHMRSIVRTIGTLAYERKLQKMRLKKRKLQDFKDAVMDALNITHAECCECDAESYMDRNGEEFLADRCAKMFLCSSCCESYVCDGHVKLCNNCDLRGFCPDCKNESTCWACE